MRKQSGQGTLEYVLVLVVILAAILLVATGGLRNAIGTGNGLFPQAANVVNKAGRVMTNAFN